MTPTTCLSTECLPPDCLYRTFLCEIEQFCCCGVLKAPCKSEDTEITPDFLLLGLRCSEPCDCEAHAGSMLFASAWVPRPAPSSPETSDPYVLELPHWLSKMNQLQTSTFFFSYLIILEETQKVMANTVSRKDQRSIPQILLVQAPYVGSLTTNQ